ncbi:hypothetical protein TARUN_7882 [Trichoderma arundinaceum]|uniref:Uncharacterized protein n=1 Tax=Trichoderma arundinaceum TaxID=490622 RepID=A0A395NEH9_TRIAR|nr:hypothetical protein TARUN_7882 [Trichoderma arundinaceum]
MRQHLTQQNDELCYDSLRALAYGIFGRDHQVESLRRSAERIYGTILQKLQLKLVTTSKSELAALIKPISIMGSYALANALVQRHGTFLEREEWKTVPWATNPETKTKTNKLLDILAGLPGIIQKTDDVLNERSQWVAGDSDMIRKETPRTVPDLQQQLESVFLDLLAWRYHWYQDNFPTAQHILDWALFRIGDGSYQPGIYDVQGPDVYGLNLGTSINLDIPFALVNESKDELEANSTNFALMQEAALYITGLIWVGRLRKNLGGAARAEDAIDFYNAPFFSTCRCYYDNPGPSRLCQIFPEPREHMSKTASWNINSARISESPVRSLSSDNDVTSSMATSHLSDLDSSLGMKGTTLLPGDGRFSGQLRILNWLTKHLPDSRAYVLGTLAAMGLSHCVHDVRPSEGNEYIAETVRETMMKSRFGDAAEVLLKSYR